jgi:hypothetical protein
MFLSAASGVENSIATSVPFSASAVSPSPRLLLSTSKRAEMWCPSRVRHLLDHSAHLSISHQCNIHNFLPAQTSSRRGVTFEGLRIRCTKELLVEQPYRLFNLLAANDETQIDR